MNTFLTELLLYLSVSVHHYIEAVKLVKMLFVFFFLGVCAKSSRTSLKNLKQGKNLILSLVHRCMYVLDVYDNHSF